MSINNSFLTKICKAKRQRINKILLNDPGLSFIKERANNAPPALDFYSPLRTSPYIALIAEIKKASPSKGIIRSDLDPIHQAKIYQEYGASAISVLTEEDFFHGSLNDLIAIRHSTTLPLLRKDFIIHPYQIYEARANGADAVLLIAAILKEDELNELVNLTLELNMQALVEVHNHKEISAAVKTKTKMIGINNRHLATFTIDLKTTERLAPLIPRNHLIISESGITKGVEARMVAVWGAKAILVGEALVKSTCIEDLLKTLTHIPCRCEQE